MPYDGTGVFAPVYNWQTDQANSIDVRADRMDVQDADIATGLSNCITKDGQQILTANIPFAGYKITELGVGSASTDSVNFGQVFTAPSFTGGITVAGGITVSSGAVAMTSATSVTVPTATAGDNSNKAASTAFAVGLAFAAALPAQATHADNFVTSDGATASWTPNLKATVIRFKDGTDASKLLAFDVSGVSTATTRTLIVPNSNGTIALAANVGTVPVATVVPTVAANLDALSVFSSAYDNYRIFIEGVKPASDDLLLMQLAAAGAADTGSNYFKGASGTTSVTIGLDTGASNVNALAAGKGVSVVIDIINANDATNVKSIRSIGVLQKDATPTYSLLQNQAAYVAANAVSGLRLYWNGGANFAAVGKVRIYGYN